MQFKKILEYLKLSTTWPQVSYWDLEEQDINIATEMQPVREDILSRYNEMPVTVG